MKKVYPLNKAIELMGISRPTFFKWIREKKIQRVKVKLEGMEGFRAVRWGVPESEIDRIKGLIKAGWSKAAKKNKKG